MTRKRENEPTEVKKCQQPSTLVNSGQLGSTTPELKRRNEAKPGKTRRSGKCAGAFDEQKQGVQATSGSSASSTLERISKSL